MTEAILSGGKTRESVHREYTERQAVRRAERDRLTHQEYVLSNGRLTTFALAALVFGLSVWNQALSLWWIVVPLGAFVALVVVHDRVIHQRRRAERAVRFYENGLRRLEDRWAGNGVSGVRFATEAHPYSGDLDIFGVGSLFELLCTARTQAGEECLAAWLSAPADAETVQRRQAAVTELRPCLDLREDLALLGEDVRATVQTEALLGWGAEPIQVVSESQRWLAVVLVIGTFGALAGWAFSGRWELFAMMVGVEGLFEGLHRKRIKQMTRNLYKPLRELALLQDLLRRLEQETSHSPLLRELRATLDLDGEPPSARIARLDTLVGYLEMRGSILTAPLALLLLLTPQVVFAIERWRAKNGPLLAAWLRVIGTFEALCSLANYAFENPTDPFPEIMENGHCFEAESMTHPLLNPVGAVRNDFRIGQETWLFIVSGSNMSGKSTLLRTIGVNAVLALAGGPVRAQKLRIAPLQIGASIRTQDSLQAGVSRFYAEILRLRQIVEMAQGEKPLLFLLDEILHGTNSHDRRVGAEAVVRALVGKGAMGLMTTHDLALAKIADDSALHAVNVHFQDHLEQGEMRFDYRLQSGVVTKSNAIELMRAVGLEV